MSTRSKTNQPNLDALLSTENIQGVIARRNPAEILEIFNLTGAIIDQDALDIALADEKLVQESGAKKIPDQKSSFKNLTSGNYSGSINKIPIHKYELEKLDYVTLKNLFYGINNLSIPKWLDDRLNNTEKVAIYLGAERVKKQNIFKTPEDTIATDGYEIILAYEKEGYELLGHMHSGALKWKKAYDIKQKDRIQIMDAEAEKELLKSANQPYKKPISMFNQSSLTDQTFRDPCYLERGTKKNKEIYATKIFHLLNPTK